MGARVWVGVRCFGADGLPRTADLGSALVSFTHGGSCPPAPFGPSVVAIIPLKPRSADPRGVWAWRRNCCHPRIYRLVLSFFGRGAFCVRKMRGGTAQKPV